MVAGTILSPVNPVWAQSATSAEGGAEASPIKRIQNRVERRQDRRKNLEAISPDDEPERIKNHAGNREDLRDKREDVHNQAEDRVDRRKKIRDRIKRPQPGER